MRRVNIAGVGMTKFTTPKAQIPFTTMGNEAVQDALKDAGITYDLIEQAHVGWVYADSCAGQKVLYDIGMTGIPIFNVNNNCTTGSSALYLARQSVETGVVECALAVGFEQMSPGAIGVTFADRPIPMETFFVKLNELRELSPTAHPAAQLFGLAGEEYMEFQFSFELDYGDSNTVQGEWQSETIDFTTAAWDSGSWDTGIWDGSDLNPRYFPLRGTGKNISLMIRGESDYQGAALFSGAITQYNFTKGLR